ncbi:MAG: mechanosensitive ion channel [Bdellovibrionaceae bacterium]|nr:mechanosensitive ion channel [Pseudobdellovibrionaceae bacterium]
MIIVYTPKLLLALIVLFVGLWVIKVFSRGLEKVLEARRVDVSLRGFLVSFASIAFKLVLVIAVIDMVGIKTTSFVAILGAAGLAIGLALQGSLSNLAGGVMILSFRPFKTGDYIIAQGEEGTVQRIDVFTTWLNKLDNRRVILPNGPLASGAIINVTAEETRRVDIAVGVSYNSDIDQTRKVLLELAEKDARILKTPEPFVGLAEMGDSSVNFTFRVWCKCEDYWGVYFDTNEAVKKALDANKLEIPFPQRDIHLYNHNQ